MRKTHLNKQEGLQNKNIWSDVPGTFTQLTTKWLPLYRRMQAGGDSSNILVS